MKHLPSESQNHCGCLCTDGSSPRTESVGLLKTNQNARNELSVLGRHVLVAAEMTTGIGLQTDILAKHRKPLGHARVCSSCCSWSIPHVNAILFLVPCRVLFLDAKPLPRLAGVSLPNASISPLPNAAPTGCFGELEDESPPKVSVSLQQLGFWDWVHHLDFGNSIPPIACVQDHPLISLAFMSILATARGTLCSLLDSSSTAAGHAEKRKRAVRRGAT